MDHASFRAQEPRRRIDIFPTAVLQRSYWVGPYFVELTQPLQHDVLHGCGIVGGHGGQQCGRADVVRSEAERSAGRRQRATSAILGRARPVAGNIQNSFGLLQGMSKAVMACCKENPKQLWPVAGKIKKKIWPVAGNIQNSTRAQTHSYYFSFSLVYDYIVMVCK